MALSNSTVAHRWANGDLGRNEELNGSHMSADTLSLKSYSTVIAQKLDENLVVILDQNLTSSTSKHIGYARSACSHMKVIYCHVINNYNYNDVEIKSHWNTSQNAKWKEYLVKVLCEDIEEQAKKFKNGKGLMDSEHREIRGYASQIKWLYNNGYLVKARFKVHYSKWYRLMQLALELDGDVSQIVNHVLGRGAYEKWTERSEASRKAEKSRNFMGLVKVHLLDSKKWTFNTHKSGLLVTQTVYSHHFDITAKEYESIVKRGYFRRGDEIVSRMDFVNMWINGGYKYEYREYDFWNNHRKKITNHILGKDAEFDYSDYVEGIVTNRFTGEKYDLRESGMFSGNLSYSDMHDAYWAIAGGKRVTLSIDNYRRAKDNKAFLRRFYKQCKIQAQRIHAYNVFAVHNGIEDRHHRNVKFDEKLYNWACNQVRAHKIAEEERKRIAEEERLRIEAEKKAKYDGLVAQGVTGCRELWRNKFASIDKAISECECDDNDFFFGGNVLVRWQNEDMIETSKGIKISSFLAKRAWKIIKKWHENPDTFTPCDISTNSGDYTVRSYENDILTAGCHSIAYCEMERMMNDLFAKEKQKTA